MLKKSVRIVEDGYQSSRLDVDDDSGEYEVQIDPTQLNITKDPSALAKMISP